MATLMLTSRQANWLREEIGRHPPNVLHLQSERPYGDLDVAIHSRDGTFSAMVPGNLTDPIVRDRLVTFSYVSAP